MKASLFFSLALSAVLAAGSLFVPVSRAIAAIPVDAVLGVTQITAVQTYATADGSYQDGWRWVFDVTVPDSQTILKMKFADWVNGANTIPAAGNIRFYSEQSTNAFASTSAISISGAGVYSDLMYLNGGTDLNVNLGGRQIQITVEARIPTGSAGGSYSTSYGINTTAPATVVIDTNSLAQTYDSTAKIVSATTNPFGLATSITYNGSLTPPTHVGSYAVLATVTDPGYTGSSLATLVVSPASVSVTADPKTKVYDGLTATDPTLTYTVLPPLFGSDTFTGALTRISGEIVGVYPITQGTLSLSVDYNFNFIPSTFVITQASASVTLNESDLNQTYDKTGKVVRVTTNPPGLPVTVTYNGSADLPINAGTYAVVATIADPNYTGSASGSLIINPVPLTVTAVIATKAYDGTTDSAGLPSITSGALINEDTATWTQTFGGKDVGSNITITPSGTIIDGNSGKNYIVTFDNATGSITPASATVSAVGHDKVYDGTTSATAKLNVTGSVGNDVLTASGTAVFDTKDVGSNKVVTVTGITLSGATVGDYTFNTTANTTASINPATLAITANDADKIYGDIKTFLGTEFTTSGLVNGDGVTAVTLISAGAATTAQVTGSPYDIVPSNAQGIGLNNYTINYTKGNLTVTKKNLTATITADDKPYDGNNTASISNCSLNSLVNGDGVTCAASGGTFINGNAGTGIIVSASVDLVGDSGNYTVTSPVTTAANITALPITVTAVTDTKVYDGTTAASAATVVPTITGSLVDGDVANFTQSFADRNVGTTKTLIPAGTVNDKNGGNNYAVTFVNNTNGVIKAKDLTVSATGVDKPYDGTMAATVTLTDNRISGDVFTDIYTGAVFSDSGVGDGKTVSVSGISISGTDAGNYNFTNTSAATTANITPATLTITANSTSKVYGVLATFGGSEFTHSALFGSDDVTSVTLTSAGMDATAPVLGSPYTIAASNAVGTGLSNYTITYKNGNLTVNPKVLLGTISMPGKVYDGTLTANGTVCSVTDGGVINGDKVNCDVSNANFNTKNAGNDLVTASLVLSGENASNYSINPTATVSAAISQLAITVTAQPNIKIYDGTTNASAVPTVSPNVAPGDTANFIETYDNANVGIAKTLLASGSVSDGNSGHNYDYNFISDTTGVITKANQSVSFVTYPNGPVTGNSFSVTASSTSGLTVTFTGGAPGICSVEVNGTVDIQGSGQCPVTATQAGDNNYNAAQNVTKTFTVVYNVTANLLTSTSITSNGVVIGPLGGATLTVTNSGSCDGLNSGSSDCHTLNVSEVQTTNGFLPAESDAFVLVQSTADLTGYFAGKTGWDPSMLAQIDAEISRSAPFFFFVSDGKGGYSLADGFTYGISSGKINNAPVVIDDNYPAGTYTFSGNVNGSPVTVTLTVQ